MARGVGGFAGVLDLLDVAPGVGTGAVEVGEAVDLGEGAAGERLAVPAGAVGVGREGRDRPADEAGVSEIAKCGILAKRLRF